MHLRRLHQIKAPSLFSIGFGLLGGLFVFTSISPDPVPNYWDQPDELWVLMETALHLSLAGVSFGVAALWDPIVNQRDSWRNHLVACASTGAATVLTALILLWASSERLI